MREQGILAGRECELGNPRGLDTCARFRYDVYDFALPAAASVDVTTKFRNATRDSNSLPMMILLGLHRAESKLESVFFTHLIGVRQQFMGYQGRLMCVHICKIISQPLFRLLMLGTGMLGCRVRKGGSNPTPKWLKKAVSEWICHLREHSEWK